MLSKRSNSPDCTGSVTHPSIPGALWKRPVNVRRKTLSCDVELEQTERVINSRWQHLHTAQWRGKKGLTAQFQQKSLYFCSYHSLFSCIWCFSISHVLLWSRERHSQRLQITAVHWFLLCFYSSSWRKTSAGKCERRTHLFYSRNALLNHCGSALFQHFLTVKLLQRETTQAFLLESAEASRKLIRLHTSSCRNTWDSSPGALFILTVCFHQLQENST